MTRQDEILNELVYQIDDIVYAFYTESNALIATKKQQDRLLDFRERALNTINEMNVRSLELLSELKNHDLIESRAVQLLEKNQALVASAIEVIDRAPGRYEFVDNISEAISHALDASKNAMDKIKYSDGFDKFRDQANEGFEKAKESVEEFLDKPKVQETTDAIIQKSKEAYETGAQAVHEGLDALSKWAATLKKEHEAETHNDGPDEGAIK